MLNFELGRGRYSAPNQANENLWHMRLFQELDRKILEALAEKEAEVAEVQTARREKARADASWMKKVNKFYFGLIFSLVCQSVHMFPFVSSHEPLLVGYMGLDARKPVFGGLQTTIAYPRSLISACVIHK